MLVFSLPKAGITDILKLVGVSTERLGSSRCRFLIFCHFGPSFRRFVLGELKLIFKQVTDLELMHAENKRFDG